MFAFGGGSKGAAKDQAHGLAEQAVLEKELGHVRAQLSIARAEIDQRALQEMRSSSVC
jgi:hypothetical protein